MTWIVADMLAQLSREEQLRSMQARFAREDPNAAASIITVLALLASAFAVFYLLHRVQVRRSRPDAASPRRLFHRVMRKMGIPIRDRMRMRSLARRGNVRHPAALLISPDLFDATVRHCHGTANGRALRRLGAIRDRLFA